MTRVKAFLLDGSGATAMECGVILASASLVVLIGAGLAGVTVGMLFDGVSDQVLQAGGTDAAFTASHHGAGLAR